MATATFRFHGELNAFLARAQRDRAFVHACARDATVKHAIEALGVPHTEIGRLCVNGAPATLERPLDDGDRVDAYPPRAQPAPGAPPSAEWRFIADAHLGGLAQLLRLAGFDTCYDNHYRDDEIAALAARENRIVLTRDRELLKRRAIVHGCYLHAQQPAEQLRELFVRLDLAPHMRPFRLCLRCNAPLHALDATAAAPRVPAGVRQRHRRFAACDVCRRVFWEGSHWRRMRSVVDAMRAPPLPPSSPSGEPDA
ncbi:twitching motility protein PilT [Burkholderia pseudomultivorans]|uniref:Mut7-C RNAse domain-containing protein n=1 Tax=Burkholderia pseudomultivorans TaxID=1207504 RepID=UPI00075CCE8B|nr:Mut7-C RNAse domain-containing protein [Burkholderia pseudomultivorans]KVC28622.1 twitching motility protein PilT [Burkholderia pseudomultivorans]KVC33100.1 twitching motility protein PilT [Burkholderia pseudomultivorans]KVC40316.1 twitching motility protein PilT [Burkholderia pseudomultivorans]